MDDSGTLTMSAKELNRLEILGRVHERRKPSIARGVGGFWYGPSGPAAGRPLARLTSPRRPLALACKAVFKRATSRDVTSGSRIQRSASAWPYCDV